MKKKQTDRDMDDTVNRLDILIGLEFKKSKEKKSKKVTRERIKFLFKNGLDYKEIAHILDMSPGTVANELTSLKKKNAKKRKK